MAQAKTAAEAARAAAAEAAVETLSLIRPKNDPVSHDSIEHVVKATIERMSASIVEEVRRANAETLSQIDEKIQNAVAEALKSSGSKRPNRGKHR
jgi:hypothetical protein